MMKKMFLMVLSCVLLSSCQLFSTIDKEALQEKVMAAAREAVVKVVHSKIDANESLSPEAKEFLKQVADKAVETLFEKLRAEYEKLSQEEIEADLNAKVDEQINTVEGALRAGFAVSKKN